MEASAILGLLDDQSRARAFELCFTKLESASHIDLDALKPCIVLRVSSPGRQTDLAQQDALAENSQSTKRLCGLLASRIPNEPLPLIGYSKLAETLLSDGSFARVFLQERVFPELEIVYQGLSHGVVVDHEDTEHSYERKTSIVLAYLNLLQSIFRFPGAFEYVVEPGTLTFLSRFIRLPLVSKVAHDALSSLLSLLRHMQAAEGALVSNSPVVTSVSEAAPRNILTVSSLLDSSVWDQLSELEDDCFKVGSSEVFRTWFQWISLAAGAGAGANTELKCLQQDLYWRRVSTGLLYGYGDQRKYCIGIIRQSLVAARHDIFTPTMRFRVQERGMYLKAYDQFSALFETIVLDRYANQVQACLPELSKLLDSVVTPTMVTTLLSAALNPLVQEGVRKIIGNWYMDYVSRHSGIMDEHIPFLFDGFLPWATLGDLFTSTLVSNRITTYCAHGSSLATIIAKFVTNSSDDIETPGAKSPSARYAVVVGVLDFVLDARGKIFQSSILYLLEGLINGLRACAKPPLSKSLSSSDLDKLLRVSRIPGLPEVAGDLYSEYCCQLLHMITPEKPDTDIPGFEQLQIRVNMLKGPTEKEQSAVDAPIQSIRGLLDQLEASKHRSIQGDNYAFACKTLVSLLDRIDPATIDPAVLFPLLDAFWEEADRRQFSRPVSIHLPQVLFHPSCIRVCLSQRRKDTDTNTGRNSDLVMLLSKAMQDLQRLSEGRPYIVGLLATSLRKAALQHPLILDILPFEEYIVRFLTHPPSTKVEFLFEVAASEKLQDYHPHRNYRAYYGEREWHAYAAIIDLMQSLPTEHCTIARRVLDRILEPWKTQRPGAPIISKWKNVLQLQAMLLLTHFCIPESDADIYLEAFWHALVLEAWPRYRFLLEWTIARLYHRFPGKSHTILDGLANKDENSPITIASLMKLAVLVAPWEDESFSMRFMTQLVPFAASPKVHIRHESNYAIPIIFDGAISKGWTGITNNPAFRSLNDFIRQLDKFQSAPWTIRTLKLDALADFTLSTISQGQYLTIESPEKERVRYEDFVQLKESDAADHINARHDRVPLGDAPLEGTLGIKPIIKSDTQLVPVTSTTSPAFFQTKSGFDIESLHPSPSALGTSNRRPASVMLIASLIDNPTNLGGLSRISESFGLEALYIDDLKKTAHKDFKATSVTSEKHFPIHQLKLADVPHFLLDAKTRGYEIVGIEQTDRSGILGTETGYEMLAKDSGTLPKKCVLVLGSEKGGISADVLAVIDRCVEIRTVGVTRSLNVQTAGGIAVYEWWREWGEK